MKILRAGLIYPLTERPTPECHASTIEECADGSLIASWFGGTREKADDVGIFVSRFRNGSWSLPLAVADGVRTSPAPGEPSQYPCWNPVLYRYPDGPLLLFYKVGPNPRSWWGEWLRSDSDGRSWQACGRLPNGILGPIKNKPVLTSDGVLLCPSSTEHDGWRLHFERTADSGETWEKTQPVADPEGVGAIQPTVLALPDGRLLALARTRVSGRICRTLSADGGRTWSPLEKTDLPNPNSGIDGVTLADDRHVLVYNRTETARSPLNVALSEDGFAWESGPVLESDPGEYSYPAVIEAADGTVHITYTYKRIGIKHVALAVGKRK